jgi:hypothetical protein
MRVFEQPEVQAYRAIMEATLPLDSADKPRQDIQALLQARHGLHISAQVHLDTLQEYG